MHGRGAWQRRGFAIAAVALAFAVAAPALALPAGAAGPPTTAYGGAPKAKPTPAITGAAATRLQRQLAAKRRAAKRAAAARTAQAAANKKKEESSLSIPTLALLAVIPFLLIGLYLLVSDYLRRRVPRKRSASLVITRARDR